MKPKSICIKLRNSNYLCQQKHPEILRFLSANLVVNVFADSAESFTLSPCAFEKQIWQPRTDQRTPCSVSTKFLTSEKPVSLHASALTFGANHIAGHSEKAISTFAKQLHLLLGVELLGATCEHRISNLIDDMPLLADISTMMTPS